MRVFALSLVLVGCGSASPPTSFSVQQDAGSGGSTGGSVAAGGAAQAGSGSGGSAAGAQGSGGTVQDSGNADGGTPEPTDSGTGPNSLCENDSACPDGYLCVQTSAPCIDRLRACLGLQQTRCIRACVHDSDCPSDGCCAPYEKSADGYHHVQATQSCPANVILACGDSAFCRFVPGLTC